MIDVIVSILVGLISFLPASPFIAAMSGVERIEMLSFLNWFIPFDAFVVILEAWGLAMAAYLTYSLLKKNVEKIM